MKKHTAETSLRSVLNVTEEQDVCPWPSVAQQHGFFSSPSSFDYTHQPVPIFSTAKPPCFSDLLIPSRWYFETNIAEYDDAWDSAWDNKTDTVYWRGSNTGGGWTASSWATGHRQRWIDLAQSENSPIQLLNYSSREWAPYNSTMRELKGVFNAHFSAFMQCVDGNCGDEVQRSGKFDREPTSNASAQGSSST